MSYFLFTGAAIGLAAGLSPGPLMMLIIAESLRGGWPAGFRICLVTLLSDTVLVTLALLLTGRLPDWALAIVGLVGGGIMLWMGWGTIRATAPAVQEAAATGSGGGNMLWKATVTNLFNPHAILFWITVGAPSLQAAQKTLPWMAPVAFMGAFFAVMIGAKLVLAYGVSKGRRFLQGAGYRWTLGGAGALLGLLGVWRVWESLGFFWG